MSDSLHVLRTIHPRRYTTKGELWDVFAIKDLCIVVPQDFIKYLVTVDADVKWNKRGWLFVIQL